MVERITSRRSTLRTLPALREEALPRPRAQRMCCGVHTESSADRSEMGQIDRSRRRRGCAGALRHKICTASLDNRPLIDGFVLALFYHRWLPPFGFTGHHPFASRFTLHASHPTSGDRSCADPPRWLLPATDSQIGKGRTGSDLDERPVYIEYVTKPGDSYGKINPFPPLASAQPLHSLVAGGTQRQSLQACLPDDHTAQCLFSACSP